ncbi:MAG TPA: histidinol-phosphate transaminase [Salinivirgaceae bacterium]|nr:histidinol-phosphate transaminase [Salinivirgaceae bacterium]
MMTIDETLNLLRPNIAKLQPYSSARQEFFGNVAVLLDANENPYTLYDEIPEINRYPDPLQRTVKAKIASLKGISANQIFLGNGSDEAVDLIIRCFCEPAKDSIAIFAPTYGMYSVCAAINNVSVKEFYLDDNYKIDVNDFFDNLSPEIKVVFICSPNNPTGNAQSIEAIEQILSQFKGIVVVDEAYINFCPEKSTIDFLETYPNLIILQTFSKAWGMTGARIGLALAHKNIIEILNKVKFPYNIGIPALKVLEEALEKGSWSSNIINQIIAERERLKSEIERLPFVLKVFPSDSNFILVKTTNADSIYRYLLNNMIVVRNRSREPLCENCLRITVGKPEENAKLIEIFKSFQP